MNYDEYKTQIQKVDLVNNIYNKVKQYSSGASDTT